VASFGPVNHARWLNIPRSARPFAEHLTIVCRALRTRLTAGPRPAGSRVVHVGSAGPGLLTELGTDVNGLFLGRFAHDPRAVAAVLDECLDRKGVVSARPQNAVSEINSGRTG
jgi:hypothetical protein